MALVNASFVEETTTTTGTGTLDLAGATTGNRTFVVGVGDGNTCWYGIAASDGNFETGIGTVTDATPDTLARTTLLASSTGSKLNLPSGTHSVYVTQPGETVNDLLNFSWNITTPAPTTGNVSPSAGDWARVDLSGLTADRDFVLPTCSAGDDPIAVEITATNADYELRIIGTTGVSAGGSAAATEWSRIWIKTADVQGEMVVFEAIGTNTWAVRYDGRIVEQTLMSGITGTGGTQTIPHQVETKLTVNSQQIIFDNCGCGDTSNNQYLVRRGGTFLVNGRFVLADVPDRVRILLRAYNGATSRELGMTLISISAPSAFGASGTAILEASAGDTIILKGYHDGGANVSYTTRNVIAETENRFNVMRAGW